MKEYLFRGKDEYGKWVYGNLIHAGDYCCILQKEEDVHPMDYPFLDPEIGWIDGKATPIDSGTIGLFSGLLDDKGNKIFEGDIVDATWGFKGLVSFEDFMHAMYECTISDDIEVIGNIYDNSELVGKKHADLYKSYHCLEEKKL